MPKAGERSFEVMRRRLVPFWAKDVKVDSPTSTPKPRGWGKPAFREAFQRRLCLAPVDNFYEWTKTTAGKQPYTIACGSASELWLAR
jgi:putative SOS response-associated peptidase YedK